MLPANKLQVLQIKSKSRLQRTATAITESTAYDDEESKDSDWASPKES